MFARQLSLPSVWKQVGLYFHTDSSYRCQASMRWLRQTIPSLKNPPQSPDKISKIWLVTFLALIWRDLHAKFQPFSLLTERGVWVDGQPNTLPLTHTDDMLKNSKSIMMGCSIILLPSLASCSLCFVMSKYLGDSGQNGSKDIWSIEGNKATPNK